MPRTKVNTKRKVTNETISNIDSTVIGTNLKRKDLESVIEELCTFVDERKAEINRHCDAQIKTINNLYKYAFIKCNRFGDKTIGQLRLENAAKEKESFAKPASVRSSRHKRSNSCDTGRVPRQRLLRSSSSNCLPVSANVFRTPVNQGITPMPVVTPKVNPNVPMSILRRPKQGEYAISISGSPLMVSGVVSDDVASVSIPLKNGNVLSILPTQGVIDTDGLELDENTKLQLRRLHENLAYCLK